MCGIVAVSGVENAPVVAYTLMQPIQHRGEHGAGIGFDTQVLNIEGRLEGSGLDAKIVGVESSHALGHLRYPTSGSLKNPQPIQEGRLLVLHKGTIPDYDSLTKILEERNVAITEENSSDSYLLSQTIGSSQQLTVEEALKETGNLIWGSYTLMVLEHDTLHVLRDPHQNRPLSMAELGSGYVLASERIAFRSLDVKNIRDISGGKYLQIKNGKLIKEEQWKPEEKKMCAFEFIYFSRTGKYGDPGPEVFGIPLRKARWNAGYQLGIEHPSHAELVVGIPRSGYWASHGYSSSTGIEHSDDAVQKRVDNRTFTIPGIDRRRRKVELAYKGDIRLLKGKRIAAVEDSLIHGTTMLQLLKDLRLWGVSSVDFRVASPPVFNPCFYGMNFEDRENLPAAILYDRLGNNFMEGLENIGRLRFFGVEDDDRILEMVSEGTLSQQRMNDIVEDSFKQGWNFLANQKSWVDERDNTNINRFSLGFLSLEGMASAMSLRLEDLCTACITGKFWDIDQEAPWFKERMITS